MNFNKILEELENKYPNKKIVKNDKNNPTEIICEVEPTSNHLGWSKAIAVIDKSISHFHKNSTEEYTVLKGNLTITKDGKDYHISKGQIFIIKPMEIHSAKGNSTWVECLSTPGWTFEDHILVEK